MRDVVAVARLGAAVFVAGFFFAMGSPLSPLFIHSGQCAREHPTLPHPESSAFSNLLLCLRLRQENKPVSAPRPASNARVLVRLIQSVKEPQVEAGPEDAAKRHDWSRSVRPNFAEQQTALKQPVSITAEESMGVSICGFWSP